MARGTSIYAVEGAVWSCIVLAWVVLRCNISNAAFEVSALGPAVIMSFCNLLASSLATARETAETLYFQVLFGIWLAFAYETLDVMGSSNLAGIVLGNQALGMASMAVSVALLTVQTLVAAAAVSESLWDKCTWADVAIVFVTAFHACVKHDTHQGMGFAVVILFCDCAALLLLAVRELAQFPLEWGLGPLSLDQIISITILSLETVSIGFAMGHAYAEKNATWLLVVALALPLAVNIAKLILTPNYRPEQAMPVIPVALSPPPPPPPPEQPILLPPQVFPQPQLQPQPQLAPIIPQPLQPRAIRPHHPHPHFAPTNQRPPPFNPEVIPPRPPPPQPQQQTEPFTTMRVAQDALLFRNTRALVARTKKMS